MTIRLIIAFICLIPTIAGAATGDVIGTSLLTTSPGASGSRTIVTGSANGCYSDTGVCVKMDCTTGDCSGDDTWAVNVTPKRELTLVFYEKYDVWPLTWTGGGCKSFRPFYGAGSGDYMATLISFYGSNQMYSSAYDTGIITPGADTTIWTTPPHSNECTDNGNGTYSISASGHIKLTWLGMGTSWREIRAYILLPSSNSATDGAYTLWIDGDVVFSMVGVSQSALPATPTITHITFAPVDQSGTPHGHWYDDITVYEGYVPPADTTAPVPIIAESDPVATSTGSTTLTGESSDAVGVSGCKWRLTSAPDATHGTACTGTTSFSCAVSGLAAGANTVYVGCYDAAGNYGSDSITVNYTPPTANVTGISFNGIVWQ